MPESFGLKLDEDEVEFIGRLLSFDRLNSSHVFTISESTIFFQNFLFVLFPIEIKSDHKCLSYQNKNKGTLFHDRKLTNWQFKNSAI